MTQIQNIISPFFDKIDNLPLLHILTDLQRETGKNHVFLAKYKGIKIKPEKQSLLLEQQQDLIESDFEENSCRTIHMIDFVQLNSLLSNASANEDVPQQMVNKQIELLSRKKDIIKQTIDGFFSCVFFISHLCKNLHIKSMLP